jgi:hypothetical protein
MRLLTVLFLRFFASNLRRTFRNAPDRACTDAIMQVATFLALPFAAILLALAPLVPGIHRDLSNAMPLFIIAALIFVVAFMSFLERNFRSFEETPEATERYQSVRERVKTGVIYFLNLPFWGAVIVFIVYLFRS